MTTPFAPLQLTQLTDLTLVEIRRRILRREFATGEQIPVDAIAQQLGVSRTPVIEALKQLSKEGLVDIRARRGSFVRGLSTTDVREIFEAREAIEVFCTRKAIEQGRAASLAKKLKPLIETMRRKTDHDQYIDVEGFLDADSSFHAAIVASAENQRLCDIYHGLNFHMHVLRVHYLSGVEPAPPIIEDHESIVRAIRSEDVAAAEAVTRQHLHRISVRMIDSLSQHGGQI